ncbi:30S ribosome-binding factor RbfA [bacterium]|nr:30S ribosome-binding factor RbfA [bacterium]
MNFKRCDRVARDIKNELGNLLIKEIKDPKMGFVTIIDVKVSDDLRVAKVYVSVLGSEEDKENSMKVLIRARKFLRYSLAPRLYLKNLPELRFFLDDSSKKASHIDEIFDKIKKEP